LFSCKVINVKGNVAETVKVPQMAESISEGTLKTWSKKEGDIVAADEEVATIETDKVFSIFFCSNFKKLVCLIAWCFPPR
jgi:2-oxoglutarate dehydrogenase E2 component (dihydrolipoamide succinyltransferase)